MTNNQAKELISIFTSAQKLDSKYREYISKLSKNKNERTDENIRNIFDEGISRAYTLFDKDIKTSTYLFSNQTGVINLLNKYLDKKILVKDIHSKYTNNIEIKLKDVLRVARNKDTHAKSKEDNNLFIIYLHYINDVHFTTIVKYIEQIIIGRMEELTDKEKSQMIAFNPKSQVWLDNQKEFAQPFLEYLKINVPKEYEFGIKQLETLVNFELTPDNVEIIKQNNTTFPKE